MSAWNLVSENSEREEEEEEAEETEGYQETDVVSVEEGLPQHTYCPYHGQRRREGRIVSQQR